MVTKHPSTNKESYTIDEDEYFDDLNTLVRHYRQVFLIFIV